MDHSTSKEHEKAPSRLWRAGPITWSEATAGLVWPLLFRAPALALQPNRLALGVLTFLAVWALARLLDAMLPAAGAAPVADAFLWSLRDAWVEGGSLAVQARFSEAWNTLFAAHGSGVEQTFAASPVSLIISVLVLACAWSLGGAAIARSVAVDVAAGMNLGPRGGLAFALARWKSVAGSLLVPMVLASVLSLLLVIVGWLTMNFQAFQVIGAMLFGAMLLVGLALVLIVVGVALGQSMLPAAVSVEGTDALDAVQRVYAYFLGRPGRAIAYLALLIVQGLIVIGVVSWLLGLASGAAQSLATAWIVPEKVTPLFEPGQQTSQAGQIVALWQVLVSLVISGALVSWNFTAGTLAYLVLRRVCDEQDIREVWLPGLIEGARAPDRSAAASPNAPAPSSAELE